ncbi:MAG: GNAT family N-acetyltransferase [Ruminococcus sp.]|nr:GNAT family N-acetyltransferase [Ruminococcus sp.]
MIFERADINDLVSLVELRIDYLIEDYGEISELQINQISEKLPDYYLRHLNKDFFAYVCREENKIVSCCFLYVTEKPSNPAFINGKTGTVLNVYTKPEYRKKGIAGNLIKLLIFDAEKMGLDFIELKATDAGYNLYKSIGFEDATSKYHNMKILLDNKG